MWHVYHVAGHFEAQVSTFLAAQGLESYAPRFAAPPRTRAGSVRARRHRWVFPGYVFFRIPGGFTRWDSVRWAPGVRRVLLEDGAPAELPDTIVDRLRRRLAECAIQPAARYHPGQSLVIDRGPLASLDAIFEKPIPAAQRVRILIQLLGRQVRVEVDPAVLRPAG
jgi:transcription antitermination factor NusG